MQTLKSLFSYKAWANQELFDLLSSIDAVKHAETLHTCIRTLNHIYVVDQIFRGHLTGTSAEFSATNTRHTPTLSELHQAVRETDAWYQQYLENTDAEKLEVQIQFQFTDGDTGQMSGMEMLLHISMHGAYHRGNVGEILKTIKIAPPRDLFTKFLHTSEPLRREVAL